jgi:hypothetical protein
MQSSKEIPIGNVKLLIISILDGMDMLRISIMPQNYIEYQPINMDGPELNVM